MKVSVLGTGIMGYPMAEKLLEAKHEVTVYNRTREKAEPLKKRGATVAESAEEAIAASECIITMVTDGEVVETLLFPADFTGKTVIQMSTIQPEKSIELSDNVEDANGNYAECPVLGSTPQVKNRELILMFGGTRHRFEHFAELLKAFGEKRLYIGEVGKASALKLALNQLIASMTAAFSLSLGIVQKRGIDVEVFMNILRNSSLYSPQFDKKLPRFLERDFSEPHFPTKHLLKDVDLVINEGTALGLHVEGLKGVRKVIERTLEQGFTDVDYSSIFNGIVPKE